MTPSRREMITVVPEADEAAEAFTNLDSALREERSLLQRLLYRLCAQRSLMTESGYGWLPESDREIREAVQALQVCELARFAQSELIATRYGLPADAPLASLAGVAPQPWPTILNDHRTALRRLENDVRDVATCTAQDLQIAFDLGSAEESFS